MNWWGKFSGRQVKEGDERALDLTVNFFEESGSVVAYCPSLDISTAGQTKEEARKNFQEMVKIFFDDLIENNTVEPVLKELGWKRQSDKSIAENKIGGQWVPPQMSQEPVSVSIPVLA